MLHGNLRLLWANLLKADRLEKNPADPVAVEELEVTAGELAENKSELIFAEVEGAKSGGWESALGWGAGALP